MNEVKYYWAACPEFQGDGVEKCVIAKDFDRVTAERDAALGRVTELESSFDELAASVGFSEARLDQTGDSPIDCANQLQQRLTAADERAGQLAARESELEEFSIEMTLAITDSQIRSAMTVIGRSRFLQLLQAYNARIDAALKPAESDGDE